MVKYAEAFTRYFDLIAERKSVIYHLRELAKASVLAKFLIGDEIQLDDAWFDLVGGLDACELEVPQLWSEHCYTKINVQDGEIVDADRIQSHMHGVYGGVSFGLDTKAAMFSASVNLGAPG